MLFWDKWPGLDIFGAMFRARPGPDPQEIAELEETHVAARDGYRQLRKGRSIHLAYTSDGKLHLRRRARQIRRDYGRGVTLMASPKDEQDHALIRPVRARWWDWL